MPTLLSEAKGDDGGELQQLYPTTLHLKRSTRPRLVQLPSREKTFLEKKKFYPSKVMLRIKRLSTESKIFLADEPAGFTRGESTGEQILNSRVIIETPLQHQI